MTTASSPRASTNLLLAVAGIAFVALGLGSHLLFLSGAMLCLGVSQIRHQASRRVGVAACCLAAVYFIAVAGYSVGKDMAQRDNARASSNVSAPGQAPGRG